MGRTSNAVNIGDVRAAARRYLPGFLFDMIEGGVDGEEGLALNEAAFSGYRLLPRCLVDVGRRSLETELFGQSYAMPFGISPTGPAPIFRPDADLLLAGVAERAAIPFVLSGAAGATLEEASKAAPGSCWFQLYTARDRLISHDQIRRAADAGIRVLVVTVDTPVTPKRERHLRNGISVPLKLGPRTAARMAGAFLRHPEWFLRFWASGGTPMLGNWKPYAPRGAPAAEVMRFFFDQAFVPGASGTPTWGDLEAYRRLWPGKLVVKGILHPDDALRAAETGCDGIMVSNHGGKVLDRAPAPLQALPAIKAAAGSRVSILMDGGVRRGSDVVAALCLGADFVFAGRPTLYGVAADGARGVAKVLDILSNEISLVMATIGCTAVDQLDGRFLFERSRI